MDGKKSIQELTVAFDRALVAAGYSESRLTNFRTVIKRLLIFGAAQGIECYCFYCTCISQLGQAKLEVINFCCKSKSVWFY